MSDCIKCLHAKSYHVFNEYAGFALCYAELDETDFPEGCVCSVTRRSGVPETMPDVHENPLDYPPTEVPFTDRSPRLPRETVNHLSNPCGFGRHEQCGGEFPACWCRCHVGGSIEVMERAAWKVVADERASACSVAETMRDALLERIDWAKRVLANYERIARENTAVWNLRAHVLQALEGWTGRSAGSPAEKRLNEMLEGRLCRPRSRSTACPTGRRRTSFSTSSR